MQRVEQAIPDPHLLRQASGWDVALGLLGVCARLLRGHFRFFGGAIFWLFVGRSPPLWDCVGLFSRWEFAMSCHEDT